MRITLSLPDSIAQRFLASVPSRQRSATVARLLEEELARREKSIEAACVAANKDKALVKDMAEWQSFEDDWVS